MLQRYRRLPPPPGGRERSKGPAPVTLGFASNPNVHLWGRTYEQQRDRARAGARTGAPRWAPLEAHRTVSRRPGGRRRRRSKRPADVLLRLDRRRRLEDAGRRALLAQRVRRVL